MNITDQISFYTTQKNSAQQLKEVARQNLSIAAQLESEATRALELLGAKPGRTRKGATELSEETKIKLTASLTQS